MAAHAALAGSAAARTMQQRMEVACGDDLRRLCPGVSLSEGENVKACLTRHREQARPECMTLVDTSE